MQTLFQINDETTTASFRFPMWSYAGAGIERNIEKIREFYHAFPAPCVSSHLLVRLIQSINVSRTALLDRYLLHVNSRALDTAAALNITSSRSKGKIHDGVFYGEGSREILLAHLGVVDLREVRMHWKEMEPVKVLCHSQSNLAMVPPDGKTTSWDKGLSVLSINIPLLMAMYYLFNEEQDLAEKRGEARRTITQFVGGYVMTNAVRSHTDHCLVNRLHNTQRGLPNHKAFRKHSFFYTDYSGDVDVTQEAQIEMLGKSSMRLAGIARAIPLVSVSDVYELSKLPGMAPTYQCVWALVASRIKLLAMLFGMNDRVDSRSGTELGQIQYVLKALGARTALRNNLGMLDFYTVAPYLDMLGL